MTRAILITGATGKQGGGVVSALLRANADVEILAVTRDDNSASAKKLAQMSPNIKLVKGNFDDPAGIFANAKKATSLPVWGVFGVQVAIGPGQSVEGEERQGKALIDASLAAGVKFFVYTSVDRGGADSINSPTSVPHFISKHRVEQHLIEKTKGAGNEMEWTILRPTAFYENFVPGFIGKTFMTAWKSVLKAKPLQLVAVSDIGFFAAQAFLKPEEYRGRSVSLAGDEITFDEAAAVFKQVMGRDMSLTYHFVSSLIMWLIKDLGLMFVWFRDVGYKADIEELRKVHPDLKSFRTWLETESQFKKT